MRKVFLGLAILGVMALGTPAQASHPLGTAHPFTVGPAAPCTVICAYWQGPAAAGFDPCSNPFPEGSYADITVTAPLGSNLLKLEIFPQVDWDSYICKANNGVVLAAGTNIIGDNCDNLLGPNNPVSVGCYEKAVTPAVPGTKYLLRFYNWSDPALLSGQYTFLHI